jgi:hypothetical protein
MDCLMNGGGKGVHREDAKTLVIAQAKLDGCFAVMTCARRFTKKRLFLPDETIICHCWMRKDRPQAC